MTVYLSGAISTRPVAEFIAEFNTWAAALRGQGFTVISPVELDDGKYEGVYRDYLARDLKILLETDSPTHDPVERMYLLPSWVESRGGVYLEMMACEVCDIPIYLAETGEPLDLETSA